MGGAATLPQLKPQSFLTLSAHLQPHDGHRSNGGRSIPFPRGSQVEVRPDETNFKDTYFSATVISATGSSSISPKKGNNKTPAKIHVRYKDLLVSRDRSTRLREFVYPSCLRPCPPFEEIVEGFGPDDAVDALYQDGWWIGVVKQAVEGEERRYIVSFQNPTDEREFALSELRVHWDWVDGSWVRPDRQSIAGLMFDVGRKVEVSFDQEDCRQGAWYPATIQENNGNGTYLVEFSAKRDNKVQTLEETVDSLHLRPSPPLLKDKNFVLLEKVDAFFNCGWWSGVIRRELENSRYLVFFKQLNMQDEFNQSELRPHMDWKVGKWFTSSQDVSTPPSEGGNLEHDAGEKLDVSVITVPLSSLEDEKTSWGKRTRRKQRHVGGKINSSPIVVKNSGAKMSQVENPKPNVEGTKPDVVDKTPEAKTAAAKTAAAKTATAKTAAAKTAAAKTAAAKTAEAKTAEAKTAEVKTVEAKTAEAKTAEAKTAEEKTAEDETAEDETAEEKTAEDETAEDETAEEKTAEEKTEEEKIAEVVQNDHPQEGLEVPVIIGLPCAEKASAGLGKSKGKRGRNEDNSTAQNIENIPLSEIVEFSEKRKRGRPRRQAPVTVDLKEEDDPRKIPEAEATGMENLAVIAVNTPESTIMVTPESTPEAIVMDTSPIRQEKTTLNKDKSINGRSDSNDRKRTSDKVAKESNNPPQETIAFKRGRKRSTPTLHVQDSLGAPALKSANANSAMQVKIVGDAPNNELDDQPLSKWFEGMNNPSTIDSSKLPAVGGQSIENGEKQRNGAIVTHQESETPTLLLMDKFSEVPLEKPGLPFVKNHLLWKTIEETMDVFRKMPQNPHFKPLQNVMECLREGFAIGHMVTFSSVVEKVSNLQIDAPKNVTDDLLETLASLETHGFAVRPIQSRVAELIAVRDREAELVGDVDRLRDQFKEQEGMVGKIEDEIEGINEEIRKLQEKLAVAESARMKEKAEMDGLEARLRGSEDQIKDARREFEVLVSTPL